MAACLTQQGIAANKKATDVMVASWYGKQFAGRVTASGSKFDPSLFTAAHKQLPFGSVLRVCLHGCTDVTVTDRGPFVVGRDLDLSEAAADAIGLKARGFAPVQVTVLSKPSSKQNRQPKGSQK